TRRRGAGRRPSTPRSRPYPRALGGRGARPRFPCPTPAASHRWRRRRGAGHRRSTPSFATLPRALGGGGPRCRAPRPTPSPCRPESRPEGEAPAVWRHRHAPSLDLMPLHAKDFGPRLRLPHPHRRVICTAGEEVTIARVRYAPHSPFVPSKAEELSPALHFPD